MMYDVVGSIGAELLFIAESPSDANALYLCIVCRKHVDTRIANIDGVGAGDSRN